MASPSEPGLARMVVDRACMPFFFQTGGGAAAGSPRGRASSDPVRRTTVLDERAALLTLAAARLSQASVPGMGGRTPALVSQPSQSPRCQASDTLSPDQCRT